MGNIQAVVPFFQINQISVVLLNIFIRSKYSLPPFFHHCFNVICDYDFSFIFQFSSSVCAITIGFIIILYSDSSLRQLNSSYNYIAFSTNPILWVSRFSLILCAFSAFFVCFVFSAARPSFLQEFSLLFSCFRIIL